MWKPNESTTVFLISTVQHQYLSWVYCLETSITLNWSVFYREQCAEWTDLWPYTPTWKREFIMVRRQGFNGKDKECRMSKPHIRNTLLFLPRTFRMLTFLSEDKSLLLKSPGKPSHKLLQHYTHKVQTRTKYCSSRRKWWPRRGGSG
jgi:hypothetical protein